MVIGGHHWFIAGVISDSSRNSLVVISGSSVVHRWVITGVISRDDTTDEHYFNVLMDVLATYAKSELLYSLADYAESTDA